MYIYTHIYTYNYIYIHTHIQIYIYTYIYTHQHIHIYIYMSQYIYIYTYGHTYTCTYTCTHTYIYIYTHTRLPKVNAAAGKNVSGCQGLWTPNWKCRAYLEHVHRRRGNRRSLRRDGDNMGSRRRSLVQTYRDTTKCDRK